MQSGILPCLGKTFLYPSNAMCRAVLAARSVVFHKIILEEEEERSRFTPKGYYEKKRNKNVSQSIIQRISSPMLGFQVEKKLFSYINVT